MGDSDCNHPCHGVAAPAEKQNKIMMFDTD
jgi:hypothetical protein